MKPENIVIVLAHPEESRNIGSVCRAMANCDAKILRIVGKRSDYRDDRVRALAVHAVSVWDVVEFFDTITDAAADCVLSAGTTRRRGKYRKGKLLLPEELATHVASIPGEGGAKAAAVFGCERTGLTDGELTECTLGVTIPASEEYPSLNLSHAVQIIVYTLFRASRPFSPGSIPVDLARLEGVVGGITGSLAQIGFFTKGPPEDMARFWRGILSRAALSEGEAAYIEHVFQKAAGMASPRRYPVVPVGADEFA